MFFAPQTLVTFCCLLRNTAPGTSQCWSHLGAIALKLMCICWGGASFLAGTGEVLRNVVQAATGRRTQLLMATSSPAKTRSLLRLWPSTSSQRWAARLQEREQKISCEDQPLEGLGFPESLVFSWALHFGSPEACLARWQWRSVTRIAAEWPSWHAADHCCQKHTGAVAFAV